MTMRSADRSWRLFAAWAGATALTVFGFLAALTIGFPFLLLGVGSAMWLVASGRTLPGLSAAGGVMAGMGAILLLIGLLNLDYNPCSDPQGDYDGGDCGGWNPVPWLVAGSGLIFGGCVAFAWRRRR